MTKTMASRERVLTALGNQEPDRVPINYHANAGINRRLLDYYSLAPNQGEELLCILEVDFRGVAGRYVGEKLHEDIPERGVKVDNWGIHRRWIEHESGGYWDYCDFPLAEATEDEVAIWPMPSPDDYDFSDVAERCRLCRPHALFAGGAGMGDVINSTGMLRSMEQTLVDLITDDPAGLLLIQRRSEINLEIAGRTLEAARGGIDFLWLGEDLGTQIAPIVSLDLFRKHIRPVHQQFVDLAKAFDLPVMIHTCGSSSWAYDDFIEMGIDAVDTLQPEAVNMSPEYLKATFGGRLAFHGCISTAGPVATGTVQDTIEDCKQTLHTMMPGGGYCFAPTHALQDNSPTENVIAMYETAREYGTYA